MHGLQAKRCVAKQQRCPWPLTLLEQRFTQHNNEQIWQNQVYMWLTSASVYIVQYIFTEYNQYRKDNKSEVLTLCKKLVAGG